MSPSDLACARYANLANSLLAVALLLAFSTEARAETLYTNDFDGNVQAMPGVGVVISGGDGNTEGQIGGVTNSQAYSMVAGFGGDFWRVTSPDDVLEFEFSNVPVGYLVSVEFSLAIIDSWDGASGPPHGPDHLEIEILDGTDQEVLWNQNVSGGATPTSNVESTLVINQDLGFTQGGAAETWWLDDGYRMKFEDIQMDSDTLTFRIHGTGAGFVGGVDESFAIDNLFITAVPEPSLILPIWAMTCLLAGRRRRAS